MFNNGVPPVISLGCCGRQPPILPPFSTMQNIHARKLTGRHPDNFDGSDIDELTGGQGASRSRLLCPPGGYRRISILAMRSDGLRPQCPTFISACQFKKAPSVLTLR